MPSIITTRISTKAIENKHFLQLVVSPFIFMGNSAHDAQLKITSIADSTLTKILLKIEE
jgi:hypothetical protein